MTAVAVYVPHPQAYPYCLRDVLPPDMLAEKRWVVWRYAERNGKPTKVPYNPRSGCKASSTEPTTWATLESACARYAQGDYDGLGFVLGDGFVGVDLDHCRDSEDGKIHDWALDIILRLSSYTEISPSGSGIHILLYGDLPEGKRRTEYETGGIEMYDGGRYFTVTGARFDGTPQKIEARTAELAELHERVFQRRPRKRLSGSHHTRPLTRLRRSPTMN